MSGEAMEQLCLGQARSKAERILGRTDPHSSFTAELRFSTFQEELFWQAVETVGTFSQGTFLPYACYRSPANSRGELKEKRGFWFAIRRL